MKTHLSVASGKALALFVTAALLSTMLLVGVEAQQTTKSKSRAASLTQEQRIFHVLNRLGFGARPGDVERVKAIGLESYINQQLNPAGIPDAALDAKLQDKNLPTLAMSTSQLYEKYPQPGQLLRQLERRGDLPGDLASARDNRVKGANKNTGVDEMTAPKAGLDAKSSQAMPANPNPLADQNPQNNEAYRKAVRDYYQQNGLQPPQRITVELQAARILRAVYSERQLQEVMVDFWTNHFNV